MNFPQRLIEISGRKALLCLLAIGVLSVYGCGSGPEANNATEPRQLTDSELQDSIKAKFATDESVRAADLSVDGNASENRAEISGTVPSEAIRTRALELARSAHPGLIVEAKVDVKPPDVVRSEWNEEYSRAASERARAAGDTVSDSLDDTWIHAKIVSKLIGDTDTPERKINVDVEKNVVTLRGTVDTTAAKTEAARIAKETEGVTRVVNQLVVKAPDRG